MIVKLNEDIMELINKEPMKTFIVLKVLGSTSLYSVSGKVHNEEQVEEFIKTMYAELTSNDEPLLVNPSEVN